MAKEEKAKIKMTVIHFESESDNDTLKENIRSIAHTLTKALGTSQRIPVNQPQIGPSVQEMETVDATEEEEYDLFSESTPAPEAKKTKKKSNSRQYKTPKPVEVDLTSGEVPLKMFLEEKKPDTDLKRYLAIAYWFKHHRNIEEITADHAYTCYRHMGSGWQIPADTSQPLRNMKNPPYSWFKAGSTKGSYAINHLGENEVDKIGIKSNGE